MTDHTNLIDILTKYRDTYWRNALHVSDDSPDMAVIFHTRADTLNDVIRILNKQEPTYLWLTEMGAGNDLTYGEWPNK